MGCSDWRDFSAFEGIVAALIFVLKAFVDFIGHRERQHQFGVLVQVSAGLRQRRGAQAIAEAFARQPDIKIRMQRRMGKRGFEVDVA